MQSAWWSMIEVIKTNEVNLGLRLQSVSDWKVPPETRVDVRLFIRELGLGKINRGKRLKDSAQIKYLHTLKIPLELINKKVDDLVIADIETFENALINDSITSTVTKKPYCHSTKVGFRKALKTFLRWRLGEAKSLELAGWLDTRNRARTPAYLSEQEVSKLFSCCRTPEQKYAIAILFDSGARAEEFINIRLEDLQMPSKESIFPKIALREEFSKTNGRTVSLYWEHSLDAVKDYLNERLAQGIRPQEPIFKNTYGSLRMFLKRLGQRTLSKSIHPHLFRHSSATFYAAKMNRQELCYRYGWRFSSDMPDVYISRAGMVAKELDNRFSQTEINELKVQLAKMEVDSKVKTDRILTLEKKLETIMQHFLTIANFQNKGVTISDIANALRHAN